MVQEATEGRRIPRATWHVQASAVVFAWLLAAAVVAVAGGLLDDAAWLATHLLLLGAVTNALFIWSWHFTGAILRVPMTDRSDEIMRLVVLNAGIGGVIVGGASESPVIVIASMLFVAGAVVMLGRAIAAATGRALPSPYAFTATAYVYATGLLVPGLSLGALMEGVEFDDAVKARLVLAHIAFNLLGWVGIPILGTIVTLWPTMLRTRIAPKAAFIGRRTLPWLAAATVGTALGLGFGLSWLAVIGLLVYAAGFTMTLVPMLAVLRNKPAESFATRSAIAGMSWLIVSLLLTVLALVRWGVEATEEHGAGILVAAAAGGVLQVLLGALSYLLPAMAAGGPAMVRWRNNRADRLAVLRLVFANAGVALIVSAPDDARAPGVLLALAAFMGTAACIASSLRQPSQEQVAAAEAARSQGEETAE